MLCAENFDLIIILLPLGLLGMKKKIAMTNLPPWRKRIL
jgi:hypothetical protein